MVSAGVIHVMQLPLIKPATIVHIGGKQIKS